MFKEITCIVCPKGCKATVEIEHMQIKSISGLSCKFGKKYVESEAIHPTRIFFSVIPIIGAKNISVMPVRTENPIPKELLKKGMDEIRKIKLMAPIKMGKVIIKNFLGTGTDLVASRDAESDIKTYTLKSNL